MEGYGYWMTFRKASRTSKRFQTMFVSTKPTCRPFPSAAISFLGLPDFSFCRGLSTPCSLQTPNKICPIIYVIQIGEATLADSVSAPSSPLAPSISSQRVNIGWRSGPSVNKRWAKSSGQRTQARTRGMSNYGNNRAYI